MMQTYVRVNELCTTCTCTRTLLFTSFLDARRYPVWIVNTDPTDAELGAEEALLCFERFTNNDAIALGLALVDVARSEDLAVTIDVRRGEQQVFHIGLPGTNADNDEWIERKVRVVKRFEISSFRLGCRLRADRKSLAEAYLLDESKFAAHGGAFPITLSTTGVVGVVTVSGLPQREDHALVVRVLKDFLNIPARK